MSSTQPIKVSKYRILIDYGHAEGCKFWDTEGFETVDEAVKEAQANAYGSQFFIIQIINWEAVESNSTQTK